MARNIGVSGFLFRWALALVLVLGTYNPTNFSFISWVAGENAEFGPPILIVGLLLLIGWIFLVKSTFDALGWLGVSLGAALFAAIVWLFVDLGWLSVDSPTAMSWIILIIISLILAVGMAWSYVKRRVTGQYNIDDIDE
jgi:hypothetical protein